MLYVLAILFPPIAHLAMGQIIKALLSFLICLSGAFLIFPYLIAMIWAWTSVTAHKTGLNDKHKEEKKEDMRELAKMIAEENANLGEAPTQN